MSEESANTPSRRGAVVIITDDEGNVRGTGACFDPDKGGEVVDSIRCDRAADIAWNAAMKASYIEPFDWVINNHMRAWERRHALLKMAAACNWRVRTHLIDEEGKQIDDA